jgi:hypothetical protein
MAKDTPFLKAIFSRDGNGKLRWKSFFGNPDEIIARWMGRNGCAPVRGGAS